MCLFLQGAEQLLSGVWAACDDVEVTETEKKEMVDIFCSSFGNPVRLDFGTGHECSFAIFLFCLFKKNILKEEQHDPFAVLGIFKGSVTFVFFACLAFVSATIFVFCFYCVSSPFLYGTRRCAALLRFFDPL